MPSLGERAARSSAYLLVRRLISYVVRFSAIAVLSRRLSVGEFGLVAIASTCINLMVVFGTGGINQWVIYDREPGWEQRAKSAWWLNTVLTTGQGAVAAVLIPLVVWIYDDAALAPILGVLIGTFFIEQMAVIPNALLERQLAFKTTAVRDMTYDVLTGAGGVGMALGGMGVWSLVLPRFILAPFFVLVSMRFAHWTPGWSLFRGDWRRIFRYTLPLIAGSVLHVVTNDGDTLLVGRMLGKISVGFYNTAYVLANLIGRNVTAVVVQVSMPTIAKIREATGVLGPACVKMYRTIALVTSPLLGGMFAIGDDLILLVLGPKWLAATGLLRLFIVFTLVRSVTSPSGSIFNVVGRTDLSLKFYLALTPLILIAVFVGQMYGLAGVALGVTIVRVAAGLAAFAMSLRVVGAEIGAGLAALVPPALATAVMTGVVWIAHLAMPVPVALRVAAMVPLGAVVYLGTLRAISASAYADLFSTAGMIVPRLKRLGRKEA